MENFLREELFVKLENLPVSYLSKQRSGDLMAYAVNDVGAVRMTFGQVVSMSVSGVSTAVMAIYSMVTEVDPQLTVLALFAGTGGGFHHCSARRNRPAEISLCPIAVF